MATFSQETELHWHFQLHSALWGMPNWSNWSEGDSTIPDALLYVIRLDVLLPHLSLISDLFLWFWILVFFCEHFRRQWSMHKLLVMLTSKSIDDTLRWFEWNTYLYVYFPWFEWASLVKGSCLVADCQVFHFTQSDLISADNYCGNLCCNNSS